MSELKTNLEQILQEKTTKLIPENIKRKVEIFDVTGTDGDAEVEELQAKIIETRQEIADTRRDLENSAATVTGTGENVTLNQTAEATLKKLGVGGNTKQTQYSGKNLFKPIPSATRNGITFTNNGDGSYILNGTATAPTSFYIVNIGYGSGTYALSANNPVTNNDVILQLETSNGNKNTALNAINKTLIDSCDDINALSIIISNGTTLSNFIIKPQLELGSSATDFEPYVGGEASPNSDYPQEITNVTGDVEVKVQNKNLLDRTTCSENVVVKWSDGLIFNETGSIVSDYIKIIKGQQVSQNYYSTICFYDKNKNALGFLRANGTVALGEGITAKTYTIPESENIYYMRLSFRKNSNPNVDVLTANIQVEYGSTPTDYVEHKEQVFTFPLGNEKLMLGDYLADDGIHHIRGQVTFDGSEDENWDIWQITATNVQRFYIKDIIIPKTSSTSLCSHFKYINSNSDIQHFRFGGTTFNEFIIYIDRTIETVEQLKTWLQSNPITVEYGLQEEVIAPYTEEQQQVYDAMKKVISYEGQTNVIGSSGGSNPIFTVTAFKDADLAIASLDNRVTLLED